MNLRTVFIRNEIIQRPGDQEQIPGAGHRFARIAPARPPESNAGEYENRPCRVSGGRIEIRRHERKNMRLNEAEPERGFRAI